MQTFPSLKEAQWFYVNYIVNECGGNIAKAARVLRLHRQSLQRMLRRGPPKENLPVWKPEDEND